MDEKNKWYKKWWVWVIIVLTLIIILPKEDNNETNGTKLKIDQTQKVTLIDFSEMETEEISAWCEEVNLECYMIEEYSDTIANGNFIKQSVESGKKTNKGSKVDIYYSLGTAPTASQKNALKSANSYINYSAFSYKGLISQLEFEEYSKEDAIWAVDQLDIDWNEQAYKSAVSYLNYSSFSLNSLIKQLEFEKYTKEQAKYGAEKAYSEQ